MSKHPHGRRARLLSVLLTLFLLSGLGLAAPAHAATYTFKVVGTDGLGVCERVSPQLKAKRGACHPEGRTVKVTCWVLGDTVRDRWQGQVISWNRWARTTGGRYIADIYLNAKKDGYPKCGAAAPKPSVSKKAQRAADWARARISDTETNLTPDRMWSGWCELFAEVAYGTRGRYPSARDNYKAQRAAGRIRTTGTPPVGALVFYDLTEYGHVGISLGDGYVVSTQGYNTPKKVARHTVKGMGGYLGWSEAPTSWPGR